MDRRRTPSRSPGVTPGAAAGAAITVLAARNLAGLALPGAWYVPVNVAVGGLLVGIARRAGATWIEMGLGRRWAGRGLRAGAALGALAVAAMAVGSVLPPTQGFFDDERVDVDAGSGELAYQLLLRIPVGTVLFEEVAFRAVLLALLARRLTVARAVAVDSILFGLWHVVPSLGAASTNGLTGAGQVGAAAGAVVATTAGGVLFCALRLRTGHVLAPVLLHLAFNDAGYALSWRVQS